MPKRFDIPCSVIVVALLGLFNSSFGSAQSPGPGAMILDQCHGQVWFSHVVGFDFWQDWIIGGPGENYHTGYGVMLQDHREAKGLFFRMPTEDPLDVSYWMHGWLYDGTCWVQGDQTFAPLGCTLLAALGTDELQDLAKSLDC